MIRILAFDPGRTTGVSRITVIDRSDKFVLDFSREIDWAERFESVNNILREIGPEDVIVTEAFRLFPHKATAQIGSDFPSSQVIGIIEALCFTLQLNPNNIIYQVPGDITKVAVLDQDLPLVAGSPHRIDSYRHARLFFLKKFVLNPFSRA